MWRLMEFWFECQASRNSRVYLVEPWSKTDTLPKSNLWPRESSWTETRDDWSCRLTAAWCSRRRVGKFPPRLSYVMFVTVATFDFIGNVSLIQRFNSSFGASTDRYITNDSVWTKTKSWTSGSKQRYLGNRLWRLWETLRRTNGEETFHTSTRTSSAVKRHDQLSLVSVHEDSLGHKFDFGRVSVLDHGSTRYTREFLEAWHSNQNSINRHIELDPAYIPLQMKDKRKANSRWPHDTYNRSVNISNSNTPYR